MSTSVVVDECKEEQVLELQAVAAVYEGEVEFLTSTPLAFSVTLNLKGTTVAPLFDTW